ncbi:protein SICKLE-like [Bidens hawaiensis]|uniref:protein SICKLE-like n=1 Tax=Bidens hawaiensis TaxID=980011 RepID=UPI004049439F
MDESTQRRERLKAMRMEASQADATYNNNNNNNNQSAVSLSNPLLESATNPETQAQTVSQSFNYYTNPMAAYSGNKQSNTIFNLPNPSWRGNSPNPRGYYGPGGVRFPSLQTHFTSGASGQTGYSPGRGSQSSNLPNPSWRGNSPNPRGYYGPGGVRFPSLQTHFTSGASGQTGYSPGRGSGLDGSGQGGYPSPHFTNNPGHGSGRGYPSPGPNFRNNFSHGSGPNQGRGYGNNMTSGPSSGRGRGGRGRGHNHVSAEDRPDRFFNKSMVEDPWKFLEPVVWKSLKKQWLPHSVNAKKPRVSESPKPSSSQPSLAEILAASFNEAADDEPGAE